MAAARLPDRCLRSSMSTISSAVVCSFRVTVGRRCGGLVLGDGGRRRPLGHRRLQVRREGDPSKRGVAREKRRSAGVSVRSSYRSNAPSMHTELRQPSAIRGNVLGSVASGHPPGPPAWRRAYSLFEPLLASRHRPSPLARRPNSASRSTLCRTSPRTLLSCPGCSLMTHLSPVRQRRTAHDQGMSDPLPGVVRRDSLPMDGVGRHG